MQTDTSSRINLFPTKDEFMVMKTKRWIYGDKSTAEEIEVHEVLRPEHANFVYTFIKEKYPNFTNIHEYSGISANNSEHCKKHMMYFVRLHLQEHNPKDPIILAIPVDCN